MYNSSLKCNRGSIMKMWITVKKIKALIQKKANKKLQVSTLIRKKMISGIHMMKVNFRLTKMKIKKRLE